MDSRHCPLNTEDVLIAMTQVSNVGEWLIASCTTK